MTTAHELRQMFVDYFKERGHAEVASSPIVPPDDPTMLFTSAGMVQFKPLYGGQVDPLPYTRAVTVQKCLRAGGKGSDLENVGKTLRHHTFFEMLGNFSFGDYFKREALEWGWDFIWNKMHLPMDRLWATYFEEDDETAEMLEKEIGIPRDRIIPLDAKENFWGPAGDTGACGPCSEVCFFMGTEAQLEAAKQQSPKEIARRIVEEGDMFLEIWNMVFPQFDQQKDGSRPQLKNRGIDTGAGLERMTTVMQFMETGGQVRTPYETDLLRPLVDKAAELMNLKYRTVAEEEDEQGKYDGTRNDRMWVNAVADHVRTLTFALSEGLVPSNEGRGYVLRRILRRALRFSFLSGTTEPFMYRLVETVVETMGDAYPEIKKRPEHVARLIKIEEKQFLRTVAQGSRILDDKIEAAKTRGDIALSGEDAFLLHATYGFPVDMTEEIAEEAGLTLDREGYEAAMTAHQTEARASWKGADAGGEAELLDDVYDASGETLFLGYTATTCDSRVVALVKSDERVETLAEGDEGTVVLEETPFYAESGGQVGDTGRLTNEGAAFEVSDTRRTPNGLVLHRGKATQGALSVGGTLRAEVDSERRLATQRNHTVTHLLQAGLKQVIGDHITQSGSYVGPEGMRFDFSNPQACTSEELGRVERFVNERILEGLAVDIEEMTLEAARARGAIAPFGEKYGHHVRVVTVGDPEEPVSMELCGGTHLDQIGRIGSFRIVAESSVAAGIRRIEGVTGLGAYKRWAATRDAAGEIARSLAVKENRIAERVSGLQAEVKQLQKDVKKAKQAKPTASVDGLLADAIECGGAKIVTANLEGADAGQMRTLADQIRDKAGSAVVVLGADAGKKALLLCAVTPDLTDRIKAGDIIKQIAPIVGGGGGGRPDLAQAGGKNPAQLNEALAKAQEIVKDALGG